MKRAYLEEDIRLIRHYFPGAKTVALRTPFDLTVDTAQTPRELQTDGFREDITAVQWYESLQWNR